MRAVLNLEDHTQMYRVGLENSGLRSFNVKIPQGFSRLHLNRPPQYNVATHTRACVHTHAHMYAHY